MSSSNRRFFLIYISAAAATWLALVTYILWIGFPVVMVTGDYHLGRWLGPSASRVVFEVLALCVAGLYLWVCTQGTRPPIDERSWGRGAAAGGIAGVVILVAFLAAGLFATHPDDLQIPVNILMVVLLAGPLLLGFHAAWINRSIRAALLTAFWFGAVLALASAIGLVGKDVLFAGRLMRTAWAADTSIGDPLCRNVQGMTLLGCEVGDDLGGMASLLVAAPMLSLLLGALAGCVGRVIPTGRFRNERPVQAPLSAPLTFSLVFLGIFVVELLGQVW